MKMIALATLMLASLSTNPTRAETELFHQAKSTPQGRAYVQCVVTDIAAMVEVTRKFGPKPYGVWKMSVHRNCDREFDRFLARVGDMAFGVEGRFDTMIWEHTH